MDGMIFYMQSVVADAVAQVILFNPNNSSR